MPDPLDAITEKALRALGEATVAAINKEKPRDRRHRIPVYVKYTGSGRRLVVAVKARGVAPILIKGARPHEITPRVARTASGRPRRGSRAGKQALWWSGAEYPVRTVHHPGTQPNDFVTRGLRAVQPTISKVVAVVVNDTANTVAFALSKRAAEGALPRKRR